MERRIVQAGKSGEMYRKGDSLQLFVRKTRSQDSDSDSDSASLERCLISFLISLITFPLVRPQGVSNRMISSHTHDQPTSESASPSKDAERTAKKKQNQNQNQNSQKIYPVPSISIPDEHRESKEDFSRHENPRNKSVRKVAVAESSQFSISPCEQISKQ